MNKKVTVADAIAAYLENNPDRTPVEIARALNLNVNSVRRTTREMVNAGEILVVNLYKGAPCYSLLEPVTLGV